jgi:Protein of unknown function (DUF3970)
MNKNVGIVQIRLIGRPEYVAQLSEKIAESVNIPEGWIEPKTKNPKYKNSPNIRLVANAIVEVER